MNEEKNATEEDSLAPDGKRSQLVKKGAAEKGSSDRKSQYKTEVIGRVLANILIAPSRLDVDVTVVLSELKRKLDFPKIELSETAELAFVVIQAACREDDSAIPQGPSLDAFRELDTFLQEHFMLGPNAVVGKDPRLLQIEAGIRDVLIALAGGKQHVHEIPEIKPLGGLRLLLIVVKSMVRVKGGGLSMPYSEEAEDEILRFTGSIMGTTREIKKNGSPELVAGMEMMEVLILRQMCELRGDDPEIVRKFDAIDAKTLTETTNWVLNYGRELNQGRDVPREQAWDLDHFQAGPFLVDALLYGKFLTQETEARKTSLTEESAAIIRKYALRAAGVGAVPVPIVDLIGVGVFSRAMVRELAKLHSIPYNEIDAQATIRILIWEVGAIAMGGSLLGSLSKMVPGVGSILGMATSSATSGAMTYALGTVFQDHFAKRISIKDIDTNSAGERMREMYQEGLKMVKNLKGRE